MIRSTVLSVVLSSVVLFVACGEPLEPVRKLEQAFTHGTPPGSAPWDYFLTSYGGPNDKYAYNSSVACGGRKADGAWYYSTGAYTFGCGAKLRLEANGKCVVVKVVDNGPARWVEKKAKARCGKTGYIVDASPLVSTYLFGTKSAGWSDCYGIAVSEVDRDTPTGPCALGGGSSGGGGGSSAPEWIGGACDANSACITNSCLGESQGYPGGMCTRTCSRLCPDRAGEPITFCVSSGSGGGCVSRCDYNHFPGSGCRSGYRCVKMPRHSQPSVKRNVCLPDSKADLVGEAPDAEGDLPNPEGPGLDTGGCSVSGESDLPWLSLLLLGLALLRRRTD